MEMNLAEALQETERVLEVVQPGRFLIYQNGSLATALQSKEQDVLLVENYNDTARKQGPFELIHAAFPCLESDQWQKWLKATCSILSDSGALRLITYNSANRIVGNRRGALLPALTKDIAINVLEQAGFRTILFDRRPLLRAARIRSGASEASVAIQLARIPAWIESRFSQSSVLVLFAWK